MYMKHSITVLSECTYQNNLTESHRNGSSCDSFLYIYNNIIYVNKHVLLIYRVNNMLSCISHDDFYTYTTEWFT